MVGGHAGFGAFVDATFIMGWVAMLGFIVYWIIFVSWREAIGLVLAAFLVGIVWSILSALIFRGDNFVIWVSATIVIWPLVAVLFAVHVF